MEEDCEDMKDIISKIHFPDLSKNFLKCFNDYLTNEKLKLIEKKKDLRGEIILNRIGYFIQMLIRKKWRLLKTW